MLSSRFESSKVDRRTWLHVHFGTLWSNSSDNHQEDEIEKETSTKIWHSQNATNQPKSTVELGFMCPRGLQNVSGPPTVTLNK